MNEFEVKGPYPLKILNEKYGRSIDENFLKEFCNANYFLKNERGIYVFGLKVSKGSLPYYVGKASINFEKECFKDHKLIKYNRVLQKSKGKPIIYFLVQKGWKNIYVLNKAEKLMIQIAYMRNNDLENIQGIKKEKWSIKGVHNSSQKKPSNSTREFKKFMGVD